MAFPVCDFELLVQGPESILPLAICRLEGVHCQYAPARSGQGCFSEVHFGSHCIEYYFDCASPDRMRSVKDYDEQSVVDEVDVLGTVCACSPALEDIVGADGVEVLCGELWEIGGDCEGLCGGVGVSDLGGAHSRHCRGRG